MYPISDALRTRFENGERKCAKITLNNDRGDTLTITEADIVSDSLSIDRYCATGDKIEIGSAVSAELSLVLNNNDGRFDSVRFEGSELNVEIGISGTDSYIPCGVFTVDEPPRAFSKISLKALDFMMKFDNAADLKLIPFPCSIENIVRIISALCGVTVSENINFSSLPNSDKNMYKPITTNITYRQILQWVAQVTGTCAYIDWNGELMLSWFKTTDVNITPALRYSGDILENDISITGVVIKTEEGNFVSGTEDYALEIDGNEFIDGDREQSKANAIFNAVGGFTYRPYECSCVPMPYLYPLDGITYTDKDGNIISTVITNHTFGLNGVSALAAQGETQQKKGYASQTSVSKKDVLKAIADAMKDVSSTLDNLYVKYSPYDGGKDENGTIVWSDKVEDDTVYIGTCAATGTTAPSDPAEYNWMRLKGIDGEDGKDGKDGKSQYVHVRFSAYSDGNNFVDKPNSSTEYMGVAVTTSSNAPQYYTEYAWTKIKGDPGVGTPGDKGDDGKTSYVHIKYSNNGTSFTDNDGEELGSWIGTYTDFTKADSLDFSKYTWKKFTDDVDSTLEDLDQRIEDVVAEIIKLNDKIATLVTDENGYSLMEQSGDGWVFNIGGVTKEVNQAVSDIKDLSDSFSGVMSSVDGLTGVVEDLGKLASYVRVIEEDGKPCIELGEGDSDFKVKITNTDIKFMEGSTVVAYISNQALNIENAVIEEEIRVGGFALKKRSNGNVGFMWKGES